MAVVRNVFAMIAVSDPAAVSRAVKAVAMAAVAGVVSVTRAEPVRAVNPAKSVSRASSVKCPKRPQCVRSGMCDLSVRNAPNGNPARNIAVAPESGANALTVGVIVAREAVRLVAWRSLRSVLNAPRSPKSSPHRLWNLPRRPHRSKCPSRPTGIGWTTSSAVSGCARTVRLRSRPLVQRAASAVDGKIAVVMIVAGIQAIAGVVAAVATDFLSHGGPSGRVPGSTGIGARH